MKNKILSYLLAFAVSATILVGTVALDAAPAQASYGTCPFGTACLYTLDGGSGTQYVISYSGSGGLYHCVNLPAWMNNNDQSATDGLGSGIRVDIWDTPNCNDPYPYPHAYFLYPGTSVTLPSASRNQGTSYYLAQG